MSDKKRPEGFIRRFHIIPKLVCLLLGFIIWIYAMEVESPDYKEVFKDVSITVVGESELKNKNLSILTNYKVPIDVTVSGKKSEISRYSSEDIVVRIDVSEVNESKNYEFDLVFEMPGGLSFVEANMDSINLFIDRSASDTVEIKTSIKDYKLSTQFVIGDIKMDTDFVTVEGPQSLIDQIGYALVEINMGDSFLTQTLTTDGDIVLLNKSGEPFENKDLKMLKVSDSVVNITVPVYSQKDVPLTVKGKYGFYNETNTEITVSPSSVAIMGEPSVLNSINEIIVAEIDEKTIFDDEIEFESDIKLPDGVYFVNGTSPAVNVKLRHIGLSVKKINIEPEKIDINNPNGLDIEVLDKYVTVEIRGDADTVRRLVADDITLSVDLSLNKDGQGEIRPVADVTFNVDEGLVYELGSYEIRIKIK